MFWWCRQQTGSIDQRERLIPYLPGEVVQSVDLAGKANGGGLGSGVLTGVDWRSQSVPGDVRCGDGLRDHRKRAVRDGLLTFTDLESP